jgi:signal transduction histidine kinase
MVASSTAARPDATDGGTALRPMLWVALLTCFAAGAPMLVRLALRPELLADPAALLWLAAFLGFVGMFLLPPMRRMASCGGRRTLAWLAVHTVLALALLYLMPNGIHSVFLVIVAASVGEALVLRGAFVWVTAQTAAAYPAFLRLGSWHETLVVAGAFAGFQLFAAYAAHVAEQERRGRQALAAANAELTATRGRLAEQSRNAERLRIARDLHDVMGHHLTALSLRLEAARHAVAGEVPGHVEAARRMAGTLLREVRQVVSRLREEDGGGGRELADGGAGGGDGGIADGGAGGWGGGGDDGPGNGGADLAVLLDAVTRSIERPRVHLAVADELRRPVAPETGGALLRCAQEAVTNAARHSGAADLWLELARLDDGVELVARDDGDGAAGQIGEGHGLVGMRERLERLGGRLEVTTRPGEGFALRAWLPLPEGP